MTPETLATLLHRREARCPTVLATRLSDGAQSVLPDDRDDPLLQQAANTALLGGRSIKVDVAGAAYFLDVHLPSARLLVVGAVHIAQILASLAAVFDIEPTVIDPRASFATDERFPGIPLCLDWPDQAIAAAVPDSMTAVVVLSHDPKLDDPALVAALTSSAFYVGALGSRRSHIARLARLSAAGVGEGELARIRSPVGLAIGAATTAEIALSILADIVAARRSRGPPPT